MPRDQGYEISLISLLELGGTENHHPPFLLIHCYFMKFPRLLLMIDESFTVDAVLCVIQHTHMIVHKKSTLKKRGAFSSAGEKEAPSDVSENLSNETKSGTWSERDHNRGQLHFRDQFSRKSRESAISIASWEKCEYICAAYLCKRAPEPVLTTLIRVDDVLAVSLNCSNTVAKRSLPLFLPPPPSSPLQQWPRSAEEAALRNCCKICQSDRCILLISAESKSI